MTGFRLRPCLKRPTASPVLVLFAKAQECGCKMLHRVAKAMDHLINCAEEECRSCSPLLPQVALQALHWQRLRPFVLGRLQQLKPQGCQQLPSLLPHLLQLVQQAPPSCQYLGCLLWRQLQPALHCNRKLQQLQALLPQMHQKRYKTANQLGAAISGFGQKTPRTLAHNFP